MVSRPRYGFDRRPPWRRSSDVQTPYKLHSGELFDSWT